MQKLSCAILGCGRVGRALAIGLKNAGYSLAVLADSDQRILPIMRGLFPNSQVTAKMQNWQNFDVLFIAVNDDAIATTATKLAKSEIPFQNRIVAHTSGAHTAELLTPLAEKGARTASLHPVQTFSGAQNDAFKFSTSYFALEGDVKAVAALQKIVTRIGGKSFVIAAELKPLHHLACVLVSNYVTTLMNMAANLLQPAGIPMEQAKVILLPLLQNAVNNLEHQEIAQALTGPIARGDVQTVQKHLQLLREHYRELLPIYLEMGLQTLKVAHRQPAVAKAKLAQIEAILRQALSSS